MEILGNRATYYGTALLLCCFLLILTSFTSCLYKFPAEIEVDGGEDAAAGTDTESETETITDSALPPCPHRMEFNSELVFTDVAVVNGTTLDQEYIDSCDPGSVLIGFQGFLLQSDTNLVHSRVQPICGVPSIDLVDGECLVKTAIGGALPMRGEKGTVEWESVCEQDEVIVGFLGQTGSSIDSLTFACASLSISTETDGHTVERGIPSYLPKIGGKGGPNSFQGSCPAGQIATSSQMRADSHVSSFGLGCQMPVLTY